MPTTKRVGDLEVSQDLAYQRREWLFERIGWGVMAGLIVAALLGLFGRGWLSSAESSDPTGACHLSYDRFPHFQDPTTLVLTIPPDRIRNGRCRVWIDRPYLEQVKIETISPQPLRQELGADRHWFTFEAAVEPTDHARIVFRLAPETRGSLVGRLGVANADDAESAELSLWHFVYP